MPTSRPQGFGNDSTEDPREPDTTEPTVEGWSLGEWLGKPQMLPVDFFQLTQLQVDTEALKSQGPEDQLSAGAFRDALVGRLGMRGTPNRVGMAAVQDGYDTVFDAIYYSLPPELRTERVAQTMDLYPFLSILETSPDMGDGATQREVQEGYHEAVAEMRSRLEKETAQFEEKVGRKWQRDAESVGLGPAAELAKLTEIQAAGQTVGPDGQIQQQSLAEIVDHQENAGRVLSGEQIRESYSLSGSTDIMDLDASIQEAQQSGYKVPNQVINLGRFMPRGRPTDNIDNTALQPKQAVLALRDMSEKEVIAVQEAMAKAGYLGDETVLTPGWAYDDTEKIWRQAVADSYAAGMSVDEYLDAKAKSIAPQRAGITADNVRLNQLGQSFIGRDLTVGEQLELRQWMLDRFSDTTGISDPRRGPSEADLNQYFAENNAGEVANHSVSANSGTYGLLGLLASQDKRYN